MHVLLRSIHIGLLTTKPKTKREQETLPRSRTRNVRLRMDMGKGRQFPVAAAVTLEGFFWATQFLHVEASSREETVEEHGERILISYLSVIEAQLLPGHCRVLTRTKVSSLCHYTPLQTIFKQRPNCIVSHSY